MKPFPLYFVALLTVLATMPRIAAAADYDIRVMRGSVQLGGELVLSVKPTDGDLPAGAECSVLLPAPYDSHVTAATSDCSNLVLQQKFAPLLDESGYALPSAQVPATIVVRGPDGAELATLSETYPYNNQFSDLRILVKGVKNPVSAGQSFEAVVLGAGQPIDDSLTCRWNLYGPVAFSPTSENECVGTLTVQPPNGRDADIDVEIVNLTDMHAVGYAITKMIVK